MSFYNIIFDNDKKIECLYHKSLLNDDLLHDDFSLSKEYEPQPIGSFILEFLNTNFEKEEEFNNFVLKYCFEDLFSRFKAKNTFNLNKYYKDNYISIAEKDMPDLLSKLFKEYGDDFHCYRRDFMALTTEFLFDEKDEREILALAKFKAKESNSSNIKDIYNNLKTELSNLFGYDNTLTNLNSEITDLRLDFEMDDFFPFNKDGTLNRNIPYSFKSNDYLCILFISFKQLINVNKSPIKKCENCNKFFIPKTMHDTKYCDNLYENDKTCKEIGRDIAYKDSLNKEPLLKAYRSRYQTLSKQASERGSHKMYEYFKKEGPFMRTKFKNNEITAEEFQAWIDSTKFRKK